MKSTFARVLVCVLMMVVMISSHVSAQETSQGEEAPAHDADTQAFSPHVADIIPLAAELTIRLSSLESTMQDSPDASSVEKKFEEIQAKIDKFITEFQKIKDTKNYKQNQLADISEAVKREIKSLEETSEPVKEEIRQLGDFRKEWLAERKRWNEWQTVLIQEAGLDQLRSTFDKANDTIDTALGLILPQLESMLRIQEKGGKIDARLRILANELDAFTSEMRRGPKVQESPPILSLRFFSQLMSSALWNDVERGLYGLSWPGTPFFAQQGWIILFQIFVSLFAIIVIYRNRALLKESKRWHFLARRAFSAGIFLGYMTTALMYEFQGAPAILKQVRNYSPH